MEAARRAGIEPSLKLTAAFSDGETLHAVRYATDAASRRRSTPPRSASGGRCIVSEPFDRDGGNWQAIPPSSFVTITRSGMSVRPFAPRARRLALAG